MKLKWIKHREHGAFLRTVGIIDAVVFGSPNKHPTSYTWQLHVVTGYFSCGSAPTLMEAVEAAEKALLKTIKAINLDLKAMRHKKPTK